MSDENQLDASSFNKNYEILKQTANWLSSQKEPDIDQLVPKVERAMQAYTICKERLAKVQETLGQYFDTDRSPGESNSGDRGANTGRGVQARGLPDGEADEDVSF